MNSDRYLGVELAGDMDEPSIQFAPGNADGRAGGIAEYKVLTLVREVRARYPVLGGRLSPYVLGGVGELRAAHRPQAARVRDRPLRLERGGGGDGGRGGRVLPARQPRRRGGGHVRHAGQHDLRVGGISGSVNPSALITTAGFRVLWPEGRGPPPTPGPPDPGRIRGYFQARVGGAFFPGPELIGDVETDAAQLGSGLSLGADLTRHLGLAVAVDATETDVSFAGQERSASTPCDPSSRSCACATPSSTRGSWPTPWRVGWGRRSSTMPARASRDRASTAGLRVLFP